MNNNKIFLITIFLAFSLVLSGCDKAANDISNVLPPSPDVATCGNGIVEGTEKCDAGSQNGEKCIANCGSSCSYCTDLCTLETKNGPKCDTPEITTSTPSNSQDLPDVVLSNFEVYDSSTKQVVSGDIIASVPVEMKITLKNQGNGPYVDSKGNSPIIISMITGAYGSNIYFYSTNTTPFNPGDERVYKTNVIKFRSIGTFDAKISPSIQYTTIQPDESDKGNNELKTQLIVKAK